MSGEGKEFAPPELVVLAQSLSALWPAQEIRWKPQALTKDGSRALAVAYIDARQVQNRLDDVLGVTGWQDEFSFLPDGAVTCKLSVRINGEWITKMDVGGKSEQPDEGDQMKAAFSDALKRVAVKFGIGRYIYSLPHAWAQWDQQNRKFCQEPHLPRWAVPLSPEQRKKLHVLYREANYSPEQLYKETGVVSSKFLSAEAASYLIEALEQRRQHKNTTLTKEGGAANGKA